MTKQISALALALALAAGGGAFAQDTDSAAHGNPALKAPHTVGDGAATPGANSFTRGQARKHILKSGYTAVSDLVKGSDGVWRGKAMKDGAPVHVALDFKGNVTEETGAQ